MLRSLVGSEMCIRDRDKAVSSSSSNSMGEAITTLESCTRLFSQRGTGGGMQAADTNALSREPPTGIGGLLAEGTDAPSRETPTGIGGLLAEDTEGLQAADTGGLQAEDTG